MVSVAVGVGRLVNIAVTVPGISGVGVLVGVKVGVTVGVSVDVLVLVGVSVGVAVGVFVGTRAVSVA